MFRNRDKKISLLRYWTTRYLIILCLGLIVIGIISTYWISYSAAEKRLDVMRLLAEEVADRVVDQEGKITISSVFPKFIERRQRFLQMDSRLLLFVLDEDKRIIFKPLGFSDEALPSFISLQDEKAENITLKRGGKIHLVKKRIESNKELVGWVVLFLPQENLTRNKEHLQFLVIMLGSLALLGWGVIYLLTRKLSRPIKNVADAAKEIVQGNYDIQLERDIWEKEIYELIHSFKEMADRLRQLEMTRTELLAGVTHELKTPVTAISGLIQAVKDEVVTGEESKEFLQICMQETNRLQKMVEDLLDFNFFVIGDIKVHKVRQNLNHLIEEIIYQWTIGQEETTMKPKINLPQQMIYVDTDSARIQQILYNLLNNAKHAIGSRGEIEVLLYIEDNAYKIDVKDNGAGILEEEQPFIFERFFRGQDKKHQVRGLGLGLPFSKLMARALGGELVLKESSEQGTIFTLSIR